MSGNGLTVCSCGPEVCPDSTNYLVLTPLLIVGVNTPLWNIILLHKMIGLLKRLWCDYYNRSTIFDPTLTIIPLCHFLNVQLFWPLLYFNATLEAQTTKTLLGCCKLNNLNFVKTP